jgi:hypothetical protein
VDVSTCPALSTATQSEVDGHDMPSIALVPSMLDALDQVAGFEGWVETEIRPRIPPATQSVGWHDTLNSGSLSTFFLFQSELPPVGLVDTTTSPELPTVAHRLLLGHETARSELFVPSGGSIT